MTKIKKDEFDNLPDALKAKFKADGDDYVLQEEDVSGLKTKIEEFKKEKLKLASIQKLIDEGFDVDAAKAALAKVDETEEERLKAAGEFKTLEEKLRAKIVEVETDRDTRINSILGTLKQERLKSFLVENGIIPDRAKYALGDVAEQFDLINEDSSFNLRLKNGIGGADEMATVVNGLKEKSPFLFAADGASGSGASGSDGTGSGGKTMPHSQWQTLSPKDQAAFIKAGGKPVE